MKITLGKNHRKRRMRSSQAETYRKTERAGDQRLEKES